MLRMCVYMHSRFIENHPIRILEDGPLISEVVLSQLTLVRYPSSPQSNHNSQWKLTPDDANGPDNGFGGRPRRILNCRLAIANTTSTGIVSRSRWWQPLQWNRPRPRMFNKRTTSHPSCQDRDGSWPQITSEQGWTSRVIEEHNRNGAATSSELNQREEKFSNKVLSTLL
jgi:hypothetical protein